MKAVLCPLCGGEGQVLDPNAVSYPTALPNKIICHGCDGKGWVEVNEPEPHYPYPYSENPDFNKCPSCGGARDGQGLTGYILEGKTPILANNLIEWGKWFETANRHVAKTKLPNGVEVSTVFLGLDHSFGGDVPILFETMVFGGAYNEYQERYETWDEAEVGHLRAVALARMNWLKRLLYRICEIGKRTFGLAETGRKRARTIAYSLKRRLRIKC